MRNCIQAVETKKIIRTWRILHSESYRRQKGEKKWGGGGGLVTFELTDGAKGRG